MASLVKRTLSAVRNAARYAESHWFDWTRHVQTSGDVSLQQAGISPEQSRDSGRYVPGRVANIRSALRSVPVRDFSRYTFVDLGSGKGRGLFVAAEFSFKRIVGVEFSQSLHQVACNNVTNFRDWGRDPSRIACLALDATCFAFPSEPLVVYLFNPFGPVTMQAVLDNLEQSLEASPRHVVLILLWPILGHMITRVPGMRQIEANKRYEIFEAHPYLRMSHDA